MKKVKLIVERWAHSSEPEKRGYYTALLTDEETMCCLGFLGLACGAYEDDLRNEGVPSEVTNIGWPTALFNDLYPDLTFYTTDNCAFVRKREDFEEKQLLEDILTVINDMTNIDLDTKIEWLKEGFRTIDCDLEVVSLHK